MIIDGLITAVMDFVSLLLTPLNGLSLGVDSTLFVTLNSIFKGVCYLIPCGNLVVIVIFYCSFWVARVSINWILKLIHLIPGL